MKREQLESYIDNPNVRRFLDYISESEGTTQHGYRTAFGGGVIEDLSRHPGKRYKFTQTDGKQNTTSAAGRYQFLAKTWNTLANKYKFDDFSERSQDLGAIALLAESGALDDVVNGDFGSAIQKAGVTWASLPSSPYAQPKRSWKEAAQYFDGAIDYQPSEVPLPVIKKEQMPQVVSTTPDLNQINNIYGIKQDSTEQSESPELRSVKALYGFNPEMSQFLTEAMPSVHNTKSWLDNYIDGLMENV